MDNMRKGINYIIIISILLFCSGCHNSQNEQNEKAGNPGAALPNNTDMVRGANDTGKTEAANGTGTVHAENDTGKAQAPSDTGMAVDSSISETGQPEGYVDAGDASEEEKKAARETFSAFKSAVLAYRGSEVVPLLSENTISYYKLLLAAARSAIHVPDEYVRMEKDLTISARMNVKVMLKRLSAEFIDTATPEKLCETAFNQGWVGYKTLTTASVDRIHAYEQNGKRYLTGDFYYAGTVEDKRVIRIGFQQENGVWKIDLMPLFMNIDKSVGMYAFKHNFDLDPSIDLTVEESEKALEPAQWKVSAFPNDAFGVKFPRAPLFAQDEHEKIYTSSHYKYGQFDVRIKAYPENDSRSPFYLKVARDQDISAFIKGIGANPPMCRMNMIKNDTVIQCDFEVPEKSSEGTAVWIFTRDRRYLLFNIARKGAFNRDAAGEFIESFSFGLK